MRKSRAIAGVQAVSAVGALYFGAHAAVDITHESGHIASNIARQESGVAAKKIGGLVGKALGHKPTPPEATPTSNESLPVHIGKTAFLQEHIAPTILPEDISNELVLTGDFIVLALASGQARKLALRHERKVRERFYTRFVQYTPELEDMEARDAESQRWPDDYYSEEPERGW